MRIHTQTVILLFCLMVTTMSQAAAGPSKSPAVSLAHPARAGIGQPFLVRLTSSRAFDHLSVTWMGKNVTPAVTQWNNRHVAIAMLGTDILTITPGPQALEARAHIGGKKRSWQRSIKIVARSYPRQELTLPPKMVTPPSSELERIKAERIRTQKAKNTWSDQRLWQLPLHRPVEGKATSVYGLQRFLNGQPKNPHRGMDFRALLGTPITAVAGGLVILAEPHYYAGNSVYIDHGNGVISLYFHLDQFEVSKGDRVKRRQIIGRAGATGRATGPHLHLSISVQGQLVDPDPLFKETADQLLN